MDDLLDVLNAGIALHGVNLRDLATHPHGKASAPVEFGAWTDDPKTIFVNLAALQKLIADSVANGALLADAEDFVRGAGVLTLCHETQRTPSQFKTLTAPASTFARMITFEATTRKGDVTWLNAQAHKDLLTKKFGWTDSRVADVLTASTQRQAVFDAFAADAASNEVRRVGTPSLEQAPWSWGVP